MTTTQEQDGTRSKDDTRETAVRTALTHVRGWWGVRAGIAAAVVLALLVAFAVVVWLTPAFSVRDVTVSGTHTVSSAAVLSTADVPQGGNLTRLDTDAIARRVLTTYPALAAVTVHRAYPSTVTIDVTERQVVGTLHSHGRYALVDGTGVPFRSVSKPAAGYPIVGVPQIVGGDATVQAAARVAASVPRDLRTVVVSLSATTPDAITVHLSKGRNVTWGDASDSDRKFVVLRTLLRHPPQGSSLASINLSSPDAVTVG